MNITTMSREEGLKVYVIYPSVNEEWLIIDFENEGLYPPDGHGEKKYSKLKEHIDSVEVEGIQYRRHTYYINKVDEKLVIGVEGVGFFFYGLNFPSIYGVVLSCMCDYEVFDFCEVNGKNIFGYYDFLKEGVTTSVSSIGDKSYPLLVTSQILLTISTTCRAAACPPHLKRACISRTARRNW